MQQTCYSRILAAMTILGAWAAVLAAEPGWKIDLAGDWRFSTGDNPAWASPAFNDAEWETVRAPALWDAAGYADYDGFGWYRRLFDMPADSAEKALFFEIGGVDDDDWVYINGSLIGEGKGCYKRRVYMVPPGLVKAGSNLVAVRIFDGGMGGGLARGPVQLAVQSIIDRVGIVQCRLDQGKTGETELVLHLELANLTQDTQAVRVDAAVTDYLQRDVGALQKELTLNPQQHMPLDIGIRGGECTDYRLRLSLTQGGEVWSNLRYLKTDALRGPRRTRFLNGTWEFLPVAKLSFPPVDGEWKAIDLPLATWGGWPGKEHSAWFRHSFTCPPLAAGEKGLLRFEAVAHAADVYVNGTRVGGHRGGFEPFSCDVTNVIHPGAPNDLLVGVTDWTAGLKEGAPIPDDPEDVAPHSVLLPFGSRPQMIRGIWQDVTLVSHGPVSIEDVVVETSIRQGTLAAHATVRNAGSEQALVILRPEVNDTDAPVFALEQKQITLPAGHTETITWSTPWRSPRLWWPGDPHLYWLRLDAVVDDAPVDRVDTRFGFREFWIDGTDYRLNGRIFRLRGLVCAPRFSSPEAVHDYFVEHRDNVNFTMVRHHTYPRARHYYDIADEVGICLKDESAFYCKASTYALTDDRLWQNLKDHVEGMVLRSRNHPSLCIWSTENEILHCGGSRTEGTDARIFELGQAISSLDATRPVEFEGDGDMVGRAATVNIHYPREFGCHDHNLWPNDAWWLGENGNDRWPKDLVWQKDKPLIIGEFCYYPYSRPPGGVSIFSGDSVYESKDAERAAHVMGVRFVCEGTRWAGVTGLNPWVGDEVYGQKCLPPVTAIIREWDHAFWTGETVSRQVLVLNDTLETQKLTLQMSVTGDGKALWTWADSADFASGGRRQWEVPVQVPEAAGRYRLVARVLDGDREVYTEERLLHAVNLKDIPWPPLTDVAIWDPAGKSLPALRRAGLEPKRLESLTAAGLKNVRLLVLGQDAWENSEDAGKEILPAFVEAGGRVLTLAQPQLPKWLPCGVRIDEGRGATMTYVRHPGHPLLQGIDDAERDLCWWRGDHVVARSLLRKPVSGNFRILAEAGGRGGLCWSPLLEMPAGKGSWIFCQYLIDEKAGDEPACRRLFANLLGYAAEPACNQRAASLIGAEYAAYLASLGLRADMLPPTGPLPDLGGYGVVIAEAGILQPEHIPALQDFVAKGGTLWLHTSNATKEELLRTLVPGFTGFAVMSRHGRVTMASRTGPTAGISNADLFWYQEDCWYGDWEGRGSNLVDDPCSIRWNFQGSVQAYTRPLAFGETALGKGRIVFDSLRLVEAVPTVAEKARRIGSLLLTNLGVSLVGGCTQIPPGDQQAPLVLDSWLTRPLTDETAGDGQGGWTDQGNNDMRGLTPGRHVFGDVTFEVTDRCLALKSPAHFPNAPTEAAPLSLNVTCNTLNFLHTAAWTSGSGAAMARYRVRYADGTELTIPILDGVHVGNWWKPEEDLPSAQMVWQGANPVHRPVCLYLYTWPNPKPGTPITSLSLEGTGRDPIYLLLAITRGTHGNQTAK